MIREVRENDWNFAEIIREKQKFFLKLQQYSCLLAIIAFTAPFKCYS